MGLDFPGFNDPRGAVAAKETEMVYCTEDIENLYKAKLYMKRMLEGKSTFIKDFTAFFDETKINRFKDGLIAEGFKVFEFGDYRKFMVNVEKEIIITHTVDNNKIYLHIIASPEDIKELSTRITTELETYTSHIEWY